MRSPYNGMGRPIAVTAATMFIALQTAGGARADEPVLQSLYFLYPAAATGTPAPNAAVARA
jgi:hypothetical protein